jgi:hypothetical protein
MSYAPFARWDRDSQSWRTSEATSLWDLELSSLTLPAWGGLHDGELCEHPTPERLTNALDYSSLPTPAAMLGASDVDFQVSGDGRTKPNKLGWAIGEMLPTPTVDDASNLTRASGCYNSLTRTATALLPTPAVNDMGEGKTLEWWDDWAPRQKAADGRPAPHGRSLAIEAQRLLPTPRAQDEYERRNMKTMERIRDEGGDMTLPTWAKVVAPLLPTPTTQDASNTAGPSQMSRNTLPLNTAVTRIGAITAQPLSDGSASSDDQHQHQPSQERLALPA